MNLRCAVRVDESSGVAGELLYLSHIVGEGLQQLAGGALEHGMADLRRDLGQRLEHEAALVHGGMGNGEFGGVHHGVAEEQDVEINGARAFGLDATAAHLLLDGQHARKKLLRHPFGAQRHDRVQEPRLGGKFHGLGLVERRHGRYLAEDAEFFDGGAQVGFPVAHIGAQREIYRLLHSDMVMD